jgi:6,7-dimethyl-8-ribityllumazine synthase
MIKSIHLVARVRSEQDFDLLTSLLTTLGLKSTEIEQYKNCRLQPFLPSCLSLEIVHRRVPRKYADLEMMISDPDSAVEIIKRMGLEITEDGSGSEPRQPVRHFSVEFPGGTTVAFTGLRLTNSTQPELIGLDGALVAGGKRFGLIVSRFNSFITERLLAGAVDALLRSGADRHDGYDIVRVPGSFEIPCAARTLAETGKYDAIICLGCLLRGDTAHYDVIVNEVTRGIGQSAQETGVPHAFGVLTCDTLEQAIDRAGLKMGNKGFEAALAAVEMANLKKAISNQRSALSKTAVSRQPSAISENKARSKRPTPSRKKHNS